MADPEHEPHEGSWREVESVPVLPPRPRTAHKGTFGTVLIVAGSRGMAGAAGLAGAAALRSGAGLVRVATPAEVQPIVAGWEPCYMCHPLPQDSRGTLDFFAAVDELDRLSEGVSAWAVGPGLGQSEGVRLLIRSLIDRDGPPLVLDADGLNALAQLGLADWPKHLARPVVITPHPGEMSRLTGQAVTAIQADRPGLAARLAAQAEGRLIVVLKGAGTIVTDGERVYRNTSGNPGMATGGTGDVLTGVVAALLAQGMSPFEAGQLGVHAHGLAGDMARDEHGEVGMTAGDVVDQLASVFTHLTASVDADLS